jgi:hypothetical protein
MAPVLCIVTTGDMHHEDALQGRSGDRYVSALLLFSRHRHELDVRLGLDVPNILRWEEPPDAYWRREQTLLFPG